MKEATAYRRPDGWYFHADSRTTVGIAMATSPWIKLGSDALNCEIGLAVLAALDGSVREIPHPTPEEGAKAFNPMLELAEVKTWAAFSKHTACVGVTLTSDGCEFDPWRNAGAKEGFVPIPNVSIRVAASASPDEIGESLREAMSVSEKSRTSSKR